MDESLAMELQRTYTRDGEEMHGTKAYPRSIGESTVLQRTAAERSRRKPTKFFKLPCLPKEIQNLICLMTFESRTLSIRVEQHLVRGAYDGSPPALSTASIQSSRRLSVAAISFAAELGVSHPSLSSCRSGVCERQGMHVGFPPKTVAPRGPIALQVCSRSRELALQHYQICFAGKNFLKHLVEKWEGSGLGTARVWVNFELDIVHLQDVVYRTANVQEMLHHTELERLTQYAPEEIRQICRFAMSSFWSSDVLFTDSPRFQRGLYMRGIGIPGWQKTLEHSTRSFVALKELFILNYQGEGHTEKWMQDLEVRMKDKILASLEKEQARAVEWAADVPAVIVVRDLARRYREARTPWQAPMYMDDAIM